MKKILGLFGILMIALSIIACDEERFIVSFETLGGSTVEEMIVTEGDLLTQPDDPTKDGFIFDGWYKDSLYASPWNFQTDTVTNDITLYAKWEPEGLSDQEAVEAARDALVLPALDQLTNNTPRLILPTINNTYDVTISWEIDKTEFISETGVISQPTADEGTQTVTLTATLTKGASLLTKVFTATVIALPPIEDTEPLIDETFDYPLGDILTLDTLWGPVSGKTGNSLFTVVDSAPVAIPEGSNALKVEAFKELQIEAGLSHQYGLVVVEAELLQTSTTDTSSIHIQSSASSPVVAFGLNGSNLYYRVDNGEMVGIPIETNVWIRLRVEIDLENKTIEAFYYAENGQLIQMTPGPVSFIGTTAFQSLFIRSGSSTTDALRAPAYVTNITANRIEALERPEELIQLGTVEGINDEVSLEVGQAFVPDTPLVRNVFGTQQQLIADVDYTLEIDNPVQSEVAGTYTVTYTITNLEDATDVVVITQTVIIYEAGVPNEIISAEATVVGYLEGLTDATIVSLQPDGVLHYLLSDNETETAETILTGPSVAITDTTTVIEDIDTQGMRYLHVVIALNGNSNVSSLLLIAEEVTLISTVEAFYAMASVETTGHYALASDLDFEGFAWHTTNASFKGVLYGNGHTISNLTMASTAQYGGIFSRANGAVIRDLILDQINVTTTARAGLLVGRAENTEVRIENILIMNSLVQGADSNGVGSLLGVASTQTILRNIAILDTSVTTVGQKNVGGVVGRVDGGTLDAKDIYVENVSVTAMVSGTDVAAGMFVGYVRDSLTSIVHLDSIVVVGSTIDSVMGGALFGYVRAPGSAVVTNAYVDVTFVHAEATHAGLIGRVNDPLSYLDQTTIFGQLTGVVSHAQTQDLLNVGIPDALTWWDANLAAFGQNALWQYQDGLMVLVLVDEAAKPMIEVTISYNIELDDEMITIREGTMFSHDAPRVEGFEFIGWYSDELLTIELPSDVVVDQTMTVYGRYEPLAEVTVTFDAVGGSAVQEVAVYAGSLIDMPDEPIREGHTFEGWYKEDTYDSLWDFDVDVAETALTLYAKWEEIPVITYTVSFETNGGSAVDPVIVGEGLLLVEPAEPVLEGFLFEGWFKETECVNAWDFDLDVVIEDITLFALFTEILPTEITTAEAFYAMTISGSDGEFILMNDIDFTGFAWVQEGSGASFQGSFDGQGWTLSNITITNNGSTYAGVFQRANGATITNVIITNAQVLNSGGRSGVLIGRVENNPVTIADVTVVDARVTGTANEGVGLIIGHISKDVTAQNIVVARSQASSSAKNVGFFAGRVDARLELSDFYVYDSLTESTNDNTDAGVGGVVGYSNHADATMIFDRIVIDRSNLHGRAVGALVGYYRYGSLSASNVFVDVMISYEGSSSQSGGIFGRKASESPEQLLNVFGHFENLVVGSIGVTLEPQFIVSDLGALDQAWWNTNLSFITASPLWTINDRFVYQMDVPEGADPGDVTYTVSFDTNGGSAIPPVIVIEGGLVPVPEDPVREGYDFAGWYADASLLTEFAFDTTTVSDHLTIYAKWDDASTGPLGTAITTPEAFYMIATGASDDTHYYLANDLDFTGFVWTYVNYNFTKVFDGNGFAIRNLSINGGDRAGLFSRVNGAVIKNVTLDHVDIVSSGRAGILIGEVDGTNVEIRDVFITASSVSGNNSNGVGGLIGYTKSTFTVLIERVSIEASSVTNANRVGGGLIGMSDGTIVTISDVQISDVIVTATERVGGLYGEVKGAATLSLVVSRAIIRASVNGGGYVAGIIGRPSVDGLAMNLTDIVFSGEINASGTNVGHISGDREAVQTNVYMIDITVTGALNKQVVDPLFEIDTAVTTVDGLWWETHLPLFDDTIWTYDVDSGFLVLG